MLNIAARRYIKTSELFNKADKEMYRFKRRGKALIKLNA